MPKWRRFGASGPTHGRSIWTDQEKAIFSTMDWYFLGRPSKKEIEEALRKAGSRLLTDYQAPIEIYA